MTLERFDSSIPCQLIVSRVSLCFLLCMRTTFGILAVEAAGGFAAECVEECVCGCESGKCGLWIRGRVIFIIENIPKRVWWET